MSFYHKIAIVGSLSEILTGASSLLILNINTSSSEEVLRHGRRHFTRGKAGRLACLKRPTFWDYVAAVFCVSLLNTESTKEPIK